jgi:hypothetical protein
MKARGELGPTTEGAHSEEDLPDEFWENAIWVDHREPTSVHLKIDPLVFAFFKQQGKGHLTRMQNVLKAHVLREMQKAGASRKGKRDAAE